MDKNCIKRLEELALRIEIKRQFVRSELNLTEYQFAIIDTYNLAITEAAEIVRAEIKKNV